MKPSTEERSGCGAPFGTATPIGERATLDQTSGDDLAARDQILGAGAGDDRDIGRLAFAEALFEPQRRPEADGEAVAGFALETRRQLLEHHLHGGRAQNLDLDGGSHAISP